MAIEALTSRFLRWVQFMGCNSAALAAALPPSRERGTFSVPSRTVEGVAARSPTHAAFNGNYMGIRPGLVIEVR